MSKTFLKNMRALLRTVSQCSIPICVLCSSSKEHKGNKLADIVEKLESQKQVLQQDLKELENSIYSQYQEIASNIPVQKAALGKNSQKLKTVIDKHGEDLHREMNNIIKKLKSDVDDMESKDLVAFNKQEVGIKRAISEITKSIADLTKLVNSNDVSLISAYKSRNAEFRTPPPEHSISLPCFTPQEINKEQLYQQFGSLKTEAMDAPGSLIDEPQTITDIKTNYGRLNPLYGVSCLSDEEIWTCGLSRSMKLYNLQGELVKSAKIKSWKVPTDIAVTQTGDLIYTDYNDGTVNMVTDSNVQLVVKLRKWGPCNVCVTSTGDLLVVMDSDDKKQTKVVRYSQTGCNEIQSIQFNDMGQPLFSCGGFYNTKYISENRNLDMCVADNGGSAVVVVNQVGKLRFIYTGPPSNAKGSFGPRGIATDSQSRILIADFNHHSIHILDQDGQFLRYIDNCGLQRSCGVCLDDKDCLFVTELLGNLKKIPYK